MKDYLVESFKFDNGERGYLLTDKETRMPHQSATLYTFKNFRNAGKSSATMELQLRHYTATNNLNNN